MNLLPTMILYLAVGCGEWYLALRRTLACARGEKTLLVCIVFIENLLGLWVLSSFIRTNNWFLAVSYSAGASAGALLVAMNGPEKATPAARPSTSQSRRRRKSLPRPRPLVSRVIEHAAQMLSPRPRLSLHGDIGRVEHPG